MERRDIQGASRDSGERRRADEPRVSLASLNPGYGPCM